LPVILHSHLLLLEQHIIRQETQAGSTFPLVEAAGSLDYFFRLRALLVMRIWHSRKLTELTITVQIESSSPCKECLLFAVNLLVYDHFGYYTSYSKVSSIEGVTGEKPVSSLGPVTVTVTANGYLVCA
jgi:hypothetical protein